MRHCLQQCVLLLGIWETSHQHCPGPLNSLFAFTPSFLNQNQDGPFTNTWALRTSSWGTGNGRLCWKPLLGTLTSDMVMSLGTAAKLRVLCKPLLGEVAGDDSAITRVRWGEMQMQTLNTRGFLVLFLIILKVNYSLCLFRFKETQHVQAVPSLQGEQEYSVVLDSVSVCVWMHISKYLSFWMPQVIWGAVLGSEFTIHSGQCLPSLAVPFVFGILPRAA